MAAGKRPTLAELAAATGLSLEAVLEARVATLAPLSLDTPVLPDGSALGALVADPVVKDPQAETLERDGMASLRSALAKLPPRQRCVVEARWGAGRAANAAGVAQELGLSSRRAQTLGQDALDALRDEFEPVLRP